LRSSEKIETNPRAGCAFLSVFPRKAIHNLKVSHVPAAIEITAVYPMQMLVAKVMHDGGDNPPLQPNSHTASADSKMPSTKKPATR
jgi:hypothetical protein